MSLSFFIDFANLKVLTVSQRLSLQIDQLARFKVSILGAAKDLVCLCSLLFQTTGVKVAISKALDALVILLNEAFKGSRGYSASAFRLQQTDAPCCTGPPGSGEAHGKVSALTG
jgi:hypothetical protein